MTRIVRVTYTLRDGTMFTTTYKSIKYGAELWKEAYRRGIALIDINAVSTKEETIVSMTVKALKAH